MELSYWVSMVFDQKNHHHHHHIKGCAKQKLVQNTSLAVDFLDLSTHHSVAEIDLEEV
jgi:hypothetical protein